MSVGYVTHDESMIELFTEEPEYAEDLLNDVLVDGNEYEISRIQFWYDEAEKRRSKAKPHWANVAAVL